MIIETMWIDLDVYRNSFLLDDKDTTAGNILSEIKDKGTQQFILDKLSRITCVSKGADGVIYFFVLSEDFKTSTCYKVNNNNNSTTKKTFIDTYENLPSTNLDLSTVDVYGVTEAESTIDLYFNTLEAVPEDILQFFNTNIEESEEYDVFFGCKLSSEGVTSRYKTYKMLKNVAEVTQTHFESQDLEHIKTLLLGSYD